MKEGFISLRSPSDTDDATVLAAGFNKGLHHMLILSNLKTLGPQVYLMMIKMTWYMYCKFICRNHENNSILIKTNDVFTAATFDTWYDNNRLFENLIRN